MIADRWRALADFVAAFYETPLAETRPPDRRGREPLALAEWRSLTAGRYDPQQGFLFVKVERIDPRERMNAPAGPGPKEWLGIVTDGSGHAVWFVDAADANDDPPVFHWDDEGEEKEPTAAFDRLSDLLTVVVAKETLEVDEHDEGKGPLGKLLPDVRFLEDPPKLVLEHLKRLTLARWPIRGLDILCTADRSLLRYEDRVIARTKDAWKPIEELVAREAAAAAEQERIERAKRTDKITRELAAAGTPSTGAELLKALEAIAGELTTLEKIFFEDFKKCVASGTVFDGQRKKAAQILDRHAPR
ncbi:MAG TPA: hypothetical protein VFF73_39325 [Planctomycetota bacterium]|nr:hypothetical protein [Planctomycetota bacterium]